MSCRLDRFLMMNRSISNDEPFRNLNRMAYISATKIYFISLYFLKHQLPKKTKEALSKKKLYWFLLSLSQPNHKHKHNFVCISSRIQECKLKMVVYFFWNIHETWTKATNFYFSWWWFGYRFWWFWVSVVRILSYFF